MLLLELDHYLKKSDRLKRNNKEILKNNKVLRCKVYCKMVCYN